MQFWKCIAHCLHNDNLLQRVRLAERDYDRAYDFAHVWRGEEVDWSIGTDELESYHGYVSYIRECFYRPVLFGQYCFNVVNDDNENDHYLFVLVRGLPREQCFWMVACQLRRSLPKDVVRIILRYCQQMVMLEWHTDIIDAEEAYYMPAGICNMDDKSLV